MREYTPERLRHLTLLAEKYPTALSAYSEIIRLEALLRLPKGTEHFMSDLHGEHEAFIHILNSASGVIREKIDRLLGDTTPPEGGARGFGNPYLLSAGEAAGIESASKRPRRLVSAGAAAAD